MGPITSLVEISRISKENLTVSDNPGGTLSGPEDTLSSNPGVVLSVYGFVLLPLALYVFHDIVDNRWRPIHEVVRFNIAYLLIYIVAATFLVWYIYLQWTECDFKEVGAAAIALILATYRVWTLLRLIAIISAHRRLVMILKKCNERLNKFSMRPGPKQFEEINYLFRRPPIDIYREHLYIAASLFDDSYPGESPRIRWLSMHSKVHKDDLNECASRIAVWMRVVLGNKNMRIWDELTESKLRTFQKGNSGKLYETLLLEFMNKSAGEPPTHLSENPGEELINLKDCVKQDDRLRKLGASIFWLAANVRNEEFNHFIATMPARWMHQTKHTGKEMMFEMGTILMLSAMKIPEDSIGHLVRLTNEELQESLLEENSEIWRHITNVFVEAVAGIILRNQDEAESTEDRGALLKKSRIKRVVENGVSKMRGKVLKSVGTTRSLCFSLVCMIRRAYFGAYIVDYVWRKHMNHIYLRGRRCGISQLCLAEITFSLYHVLTLATVDLCPERNLFNEKHFEKEKEKVSLLSCDGRVVQESGCGVQKCPVSAFRVFVKVAESAAQKVYDSFFDAIRHNYADPEELRSLSKSV